MQQRIKNNAKEIKDYLSDLYEWEESMEEKDKHRLQKPTAVEPEPIREKEKPPENK